MKMYPWHDFLSIQWNKRMQYNLLTQVNKALRYDWPSSNKLDPQLIKNCIVLLAFQQLSKLQNSMKWTKKYHIREDKRYGQQKKTAVSVHFGDSLTVSSIKHVPRTKKRCGDSSNTTVCYPPGIQITVKNQSHCIDEEQERWPCHQSWILSSELAAVLFSRCNREIHMAVAWKTCS